MTVDPRVEAVVSNRSLPGLVKRSCDAATAVADTLETVMRRIQGVPPSGQSGNVVTHNPILDVREIRKAVERVRGLNTVILPVLAPEPAAGGRPSIGPPTPAIIDGAALRRAVRRDPSFRENLGAAIRMTSELDAATRGALPKGYRAGPNGIEFDLSHPIYDHFSAPGALLELLDRLEDGLE